MKAPSLIQEVQKGESFSSFDLDLHQRQKRAEPLSTLPYTATAAAALPELILTDNLPAAKAEPDSRSVVVVDKTKHQTHILQMHNGIVADVLKVPDATGKGPGMTPEGKFHVVGKEKNPTWYPPESIGGGPVGPGPHNPLGVAKIRIDAFGGRILLHGTNRPDQIGTNASHGCIRHNNQDILKIYPLLQRGDAVYIVKNFSGTVLRKEDFLPRTN